MSRLRSARHLLNRRSAGWALLAFALVAASPASGQVTIEKRTNGQSADAAPGPSILIGDPVNWTYTVTNTGDRPLESIVVTDDQGVAVSCPATTLDVGLSFVCTGNGTAVAGQYANVGTVDANIVVLGTPVQDTDPSHYFGVPEPAITLEKATNGLDSDSPPGQSLAVGSPVAWTYEVENISSSTLTNVSVADDQGVVVSCPLSTLSPGQSMTCTGSGTVSVGQYANVGTASGELPGSIPVVDTDPSHYFGQVIVLEKATNGVDADSPQGPQIPIGDPVVWTYEVSNPGPAAVSNVVVTDDQGVAVSCPQTGLSAGESMICTGNGTAVPGQYSNLGTVTADLAGGGGVVSDSDPSHYIAFPITIEKATNGQDADLPPGPVVAVGSPITWTYRVTNVSMDTLTAVVVTDDQGVVVSCPATSLSPGASMTCTGSGNAAAGQYANVGDAEATHPTLGQIAASDSSHYFGGAADHDFGDAPDPTYKTLLASVGAEHVIDASVFLGACVDSELDGQAAAGADGDDLGAGLQTEGTCAVAGEDEDGVVLPAAGLAVGLTTDIEVIANDACVLSAYIDLNADGDFSDAGEEMTGGGQALTAGSNTVSLVIPASAVVGSTYARFRCTTDGFVPPGGLASDGEVEDYRLDLFDPPVLTVTKVDLPGTPAVPGDTISYEVEIANSGGEATDLVFDDTVDPNTTQSSPVTTTPLAIDDGVYNADPTVPTVVDGTLQPVLLDNDFGLPVPTVVAAVGQATTLGGSVDVNTDGSFTYTPPGGATGGEVDTFTYENENGQPVSGPVTDMATATIQLGLGPVAEDDALSALQNTVAVLDAAADNGSGADNFGVPPGAVDAYGPVGGPLATSPGNPFVLASGNTVNFDVSGNGTFTYDATVNPTFSGNETFEYQITNVSGSDTAIVTLEIQALPVTVDDGPAGGAAPGDPYATLPGVPIDTTGHATPPVIVNDDLGFPLATVVSYGTSTTPGDVTVPGAATPTDNGGTVVVSADGNFVYTPPGGFGGNDAFGYTIANAAGADSAVVTILVASPPSAEDDTLAATQNASTLLDAAADNGSGADDFGSPAGAVDFYGPVGGPLATAPGNAFALASGNTVNFDVSGNGMFTYDATVNPTFSGSESVDYQITNVAGSDTATVTIEVQAPPIANDDSPDMLSAPDDAYHTALDTALDSSAHATPPVLDNDDLGFPLGALVSYGLSSDATVQTTLGATTPTDNGGTVSMTADGNFVYTPPNATFTGPDLFAYRLENSAGFDDGVVTIAVGQRPVCDDELGPDDDYDALGNVGITVPGANGVLIGDTGDEITVSGNTAPGSGGIATVAADGGFTYTSGPGFTGTDSFTYTVGNGFGDSSACTVEVVVANTIWFVDNSAGGGGNGTLGAPFDELNDMSTAADGAGDIIFIDFGDGSSTDYTSGITLLNNQQLIGQGVDLATEAGLTPPTFSDGLPPAAGTPAIGSNGGNGVTLASANNVAGLEVFSTAGAAITGTGVAAGTFEQVTISDATSSGINLDSATGTFTFTGVNNINTTTASTAFNLVGGTATVTYNGNITQSNNAAAVNISGHSTGTVTFQNGTIMATNGTGLQFSNADGTYNFSGTATLNGGDAGIDILSGSAGTFTFTDTDITNPSGVAFNLAGGTAAVDFQGASSINQGSNEAAVSVSGGHGTGTVSFIGTVNATNGSGYQFNNADGVYSFAAANTLNGGDAGIDILNGSSGSFTFSNLTITTPTNGAFNVDSSAASITYTAGSITQNSAATAFRANGNGAGIRNIFVPITANTSTATAISLTSNSGTFNFTGQLDIDTTSGGGFIATGGGTVSATATTNDVDTTTGIGINIEDTTISAAGVTFSSVSSNGGATTIDIDTTGTSGSFVVTGNATDVLGGDASGGTIQSPTADGITIAGPANFSIKNMLIDSPAQEGIHIGRDVVPPAAASRLSWTGTGRFDNIRVRNVDVANTSAVRVINGSGTANLTVDRSVFTDADSGQTMFLVSAFDTADTTVTVEDSEFSSLQPAAYQHSAGLDPGDLPTVTSVLRRNNFINAKGPVGSSEVNLLKAHGGTSRCVVEDNIFDSVGLFGVVNGILNVGGNSDFAAGVGEILCLIDGNDFSDLPGKTRAINVKVEPASGTAGLVDVTIDNNRFDDLLDALNDATAIYVEFENNVPTSNIRIRSNRIGQGDLAGSTAGDVGGSRDGVFIQLDDDGAKTMNLLMEDNLVRVTNSGTTIAGAVSGDQLVQINADDTGNRINATIHGNTFNNDGTGDVVLRSDEGPAGAVCLDLNAANNGADSNAGNQPIVLVRDSGTTFETEGTSGTDGTVETFLNARNGATVDAQGDGGGGFTNVACPLPPAPPTLP